jgi:hypothetical protein
LGQDTLRVQVRKNRNLSRQQALEHVKLQVRVQQSS